MTRLHWSGTFETASWTRAQHATVLVEHDGDRFAASIIGDDGFATRYLVPRESLGNFLGGVTQAWSVDHQSGTLVTLVNLAAQGSTGGPIKPPPGPPGDPVIHADGSTGGPIVNPHGPGGKGAEPPFMIIGQAVLAAHTLLALAEIVSRFEP